MGDAGEPVHDERLWLVLLCAHPALSRENAAALTLRMVMGVSTADIARLFLMSTATMSARLTRSRKGLAGEHAIAPHPDATDWPRIVERYDELLALEDSPVVRLNRAGAISEADGPLAGLRALDGVELPGHRLPGVRGELLARVGRTDEARSALVHAVELCDNTLERAHLESRLAALA